MSRVPLEPLLDEIAVELGRQETSQNFLPNYDILDTIAEKANDLSFNAESSLLEHRADRQAGAIAMAVLAIRLLRDGCGGHGA